MAIRISNDPSMNLQPDAEEVVAATRTWLEKAVIGLDLCPYAGPVHLHNRIRYFVSVAQSPKQLLDDLMAELRALQQSFVHAPIDRKSVV